MDTTNTFISTGITTAIYILYKIAQRYYFKSGCHNRTLEIVIVDREEEQKLESKEEPKQEKKEPVIEMI